MANNATGSASDRLPHPFNELLAAATVPPQAEFLVHSVKVVCGRQAETNCCCTAGARPGVYATEVNIQNITGQPAQVAKFFVPLINAGAVVGREPKFVDPTKIFQHTGELITLPPLAATMDDCCTSRSCCSAAPQPESRRLRSAISRSGASSNWPSLRSTQRPP